MTLFKSRSECYCWPIIVYIIVFFVHWCRETDDIIFICLALNSTASAHRQVFHSWTGATQTLGASTTACFGWHKSLTCKAKRKTTRGPIRCVSKPNRCVSKLNIFAGGKRERRSWWIWRIWQRRGMYFWCECDVDCLALWWMFTSFSYLLPSFAIPNSMVSNPDWPLQGGVV